MIGWLVTAFFSYVRKLVTPTPRCYLNETPESTIYTHSLPGHLKPESGGSQDVTWDSRPRLPHIVKDLFTAQSGIGFCSHHSFFSHERTSRDIVVNADLGLATTGSQLHTLEFYHSAVCNAGCSDPEDLRLTNARWSIRVVNAKRWSRRPDSDIIHVTGVCREGSKRCVDCSLSTTSGAVSQSKVYSSHQPGTDFQFSMAQSEQSASTSNDQHSGKDVRDITNPNNTDIVNNQNKDLEEYRRSQHKKWSRIRSEDLQKKNKRTLPRDRRVDAEKSGSGNVVSTNANINAGKRSKKRSIPRSGSGLCRRKRSKSNERRKAGSVHKEGSVRVGENRDQAKPLTSGWHPRKELKKFGRGFNQGQQKVPKLSALDSSSTKDSHPVPSLGSRSKNKRRKPWVYQRRSKPKTPHEINDKEKESSARSADEGTTAVTRNSGAEEGSKHSLQGGDKLEVIDMDLETSSHESIEILPSSSSSSSVSHTNETTPSVSIKEVTHTKTSEEDIMYMGTVIDLTDSPPRNPPELPDHTNTYTGTDTGNTITTTGSSSARGRVSMVSQSHNEWNWTVSHSATRYHYRGADNSVYTTGANHAAPLLQQPPSHSFSGNGLLALPSSQPTSYHNGLLQCSWDTPRCTSNTSQMFQGHQIQWSRKDFSSWNPAGHRPERRYHSSDANSRGSQNERRSSPHARFMERSPHAQFIERMDRLRNRRWEVMDHPKRCNTKKSKQARCMIFSVASYNILAQNLLEDNIYLYRGSKEEQLNWDFRKENLLDEIRRHMPDVLGLQEVNAQHFKDFFMPALGKLGYKGEFKKRTRSMEDGCATFFKQSVFELDSVVPVEYHHPGVDVLNRDNVALLLRLRPVQGNRHSQIVVANTHLLYNPKRGDVKLAQIMVLMAELDRIAYIPQTCQSQQKMYPSIVLGDFNSVPYSKLYQLLDRGKLMYEGEVMQDFTGQERDSYGESRYFGREVIPKNVGITDNCQYVAELEHRARFTDTNRMPERRVSSGQSETDDDCLIDDESMQKLHVAEIKSRAGTSRTLCDDSQAGGSQQSQKPEEKRNDYTNYLPKYVQCTGHVSLPLTLASVYNHTVRCPKTGRKDREVSTNHGKTNCTVDYIFYSVKRHSTHKQDRPSREERLELLSRLTLLSDREMDKYGPLPNDVVSADHLLLMAKFSLKISREEDRM